MTTERTDPPLAADEATMLTAFLDFYRATVRRQAEGLTAQQLATRLAPSTMTIGGMLKHLAFVEHWWLPVVLLGRDYADPWADVEWKAEPDWDWTSAAADPASYLFELYDAAWAESNKITAEALAGGGLDTVSVRPNRRLDQPYSLRWILVHLIEEYARHAGHADLIRESIDGATDL